MSLQPQTRVRASRDIQRGHHGLVKRGAHGIVVDAHPHWSGGSYTVESQADFDKWMADNAPKTAASPETAPAAAPETAPAAAPAAP